MVGSLGGGEERVTMRGWQGDGDKKRVARRGCSTGWQSVEMVLREGLNYWCVNSRECSTLLPCYEGGGT